jgi:hypothetical protein
MSDGKQALLRHLKAAMERSKGFVEGKIGDVAGTVAEVLEDLYDVKSDKSKGTLIKISTDGWVDDETYPDFPYRLNIKAEDITKNDRVDICISPDCLSAAGQAMLCPTCNTIAGYIQVWSKSIPTEVIEAEYWVSQGKE